MNIEKENSGFDILREEFEVVLRRLRDKAPRTVNNAELLKKSGSHLKEWLFRLIKKIYTNEELLSDLREKLMVSILKDSDVKKCERYRTISLLVPASQIDGNVMLHQIENHKVEFLIEDQFCFTKGKGS